jgi:hypothetical protein
MKTTILATLFLMITAPAFASAPSDPLVLVGAEVILHQVLAQNLLAGDANSQRIVSSTINGNGVPYSPVVNSMVNGKDGGLGTFYYDIEIGTYNEGVSPPKYTRVNTIEVGIHAGSGVIVSANAL